MSIQKIGIDKLILTGKEFSVSDVSPAFFGIDRNIRQGSRDESLPYLLTDASGKDVRAHKIYHNNTHSSITINQYGLNIAFNPNKIINPYQLSDISSSSFSDSLSVIDKHLKKIGISVNIENMKLNRVDIAKQDEMRHPVFHYGEAFKLLAAKRKMSKRTYLETHTIGNTQHQVCFYDKEKELLSEGLKHYMQGEKNLMRGEIRFLKSNCTQKILHSTTLHDLRKLKSTDIADVYSHYMNKNIFNSQAPGLQMSFDFEKDVELFKYLRQQYKNRALNMFFLIGNIEEKVIAAGGIDNLLKIFTAAGCNRLFISRSRKYIENMITLKAEIDKSRQAVSVSMLLDELKLKFAA